MLSFLTLLVWAPVLQEPQPSEPSAAALHERVHQLRKDLLVGGESVRRAEEEAIAFYETRMEALNEQADLLSVDLAEKQAQYDLALDRTLTAETDTARRAAAAEAASLKREIQAIRDQIAALERSQGELADAIAAVEAKMRERQRLEAEFESTGVAPDPLITPGGLGLAPTLPEDPGLDPLQDADLLTDLMARDPERARELILRTDPERYWRLWPLQPDAEVLRKAIRFPVGDPPEDR